MVASGTAILQVCKQTSGKIPLGDVEAQAPMPNSVLRSARERIETVAGQISDVDSSLDS